MLANIIEKYPMFIYIILVIILETVKLAPVPLSFPVKHITHKER